MQIATWTIKDGSNYEHRIVAENPTDKIQFSCYDNQGRLHYFSDRSYYISLWCSEHGFSCERKLEQKPKRVNGNNSQGWTNNG